MTAQIKIEKLSLGGQGIGYIDGKVCFVDDVIPGEEVTVKILLQKRDYTQAKCLRVLRPSPYRIKPRCLLFGVCGGCHLQHIDYQQQLNLKKEIFLDTLHRIGKVIFNNISIFSADPWHYRNRAQLPVQRNGTLKIGYFKKGTHEVVNHTHCLINHQRINELLPVVKEGIEESQIKIYDESNYRGNLRHIIIRVGIRTNQVYITFVTREEVIPKRLFVELPKRVKNLTGISQNINPARVNRIMGERNIILWGNEFYEERFDNKTFRISPASFFQVNINLFEKIIELIKRETFYTDVLDLYSGVGVVGICIAPNVSRVIAIEGNLNAVRDGINNAQLNKIDNIEFIAGKVEGLVSKIKEVGIAILDPPRKGVSPEVIIRLTDLKVKKIIYLSCNPATLARDLQIFLKKGYHIENFFLFDMFPHTYHIESLTVLTT